MDFFTDNDGEETWIELVANLSSYVWANTRVGAEFSTDVSVPDEEESSYRLTVFWDAIF